MAPTEQVNVPLCGACQNPFLSVCAPPNATVVALRGYAALALPDGQRNSLPSTHDAGMGLANALTDEVGGLCTDASGCPEPLGHILSVQGVRFMV